MKLTVTKLTDRVIKGNLKKWFESATLKQIEGLNYNTLYMN